MKKHISTAVVFFTSLLGFLFLGLPFITLAGEATSGYDFLKEVKQFPTKELESAFNTTKVAVIFLIVLFSVAMVYCIVKLLIDLKVIKIKNTAWTEWVNLALVVLITIFAIVAICGVSSYVAELNKYYKAFADAAGAIGGIIGVNTQVPKVSVGYGIISALVVYCLTLAVEIAWVVILSLKKSNKK